MSVIMGNGNVNLGWTSANPENPVMIYARCQDYRVASIMLKLIHSVV